jgi:hypothetical protein
MALVGLSRLCNKLGGGYLEAYYTPTVGVEWFVPIVNEVTNRLLRPPVLLPTQSWFLLPYVQGTDHAISESATDTKQGVQFKPVLTAVLPPITPEVQAELVKMKLLKYFLLQFRDKNGRWWLMGDLDFPCEFDYDYSSTKVTIRFEAKTARPLQYLN